MQTHPEKSWHLYLARSEPVIVFSFFHPKKRNTLWLVGDVVSVSRQPITLIFFICSREQIRRVEIKTCFISRRISVALNAFNFQTIDNVASHQQTILLITISERVALWL